MSPTTARSSQPLSIVSLVAGVVGVVTFLVAPILGNRVPFGVLLGILTVAGPVALITGVAALRVIRREHLGGLWFALLGTLLGLGILLLEIFLLLIALVFTQGLSTL